MALKRMNIKVPEEMHGMLQEEAEKRGLTMNAVIIIVMEKHFAEQQQEEEKKNL